MKKIYEEAWIGIPISHRHLNAVEPEPLQQTYTNREEFWNDVHRLIVECNIHGVDIDSRAVQLPAIIVVKAQRSGNARDSNTEKASDRKSNVVCAEPMPRKKQCRRVRRQAETTVRALWR